MLKTIPRALTCITPLTLLAVLALPLQLAAQDTRYKLIDVGTFGGPNSGTGFEASPLNALSSHGVFTACADTSIRDPNYPNFNPLILPTPNYGLPQPDPVIFHAFQWKNGTLTDLGALPGINSSCASHISGDGLIAGQSETSVIDPITGWPEAQAVLWKHGQLVNLGTLGGYESLSTAVNNRGQVVGQADNAKPDPFGIGFGQQARAFLWENGVMQDLGTLGGPDAFAIDINDRGQILGVSFTNATPEPTTGVPTFDGFLWENGKMTDIPDPLGGTQVSPFYLSNKGQVLGSVNLTGDNFEQARHPFLWENGVFTDLGTFGGTIGDANKINDAGQIVGDATFADGRDHAAIWQNGMIFDLGTVGSDDCSGGLDINSLGQVVGFSAACDGSTFRAILWEKGGPMVDLNTLISSDSGIYVFIATNINDRGEIAGSGVLPDGNIRAVLLTPCGEGREGCGASAATTTRDNSPLTTAQRLAGRRMMARSRTRLGPLSRIRGLSVPKD
jgi:probable HAF family extracellular repeat protein